MQKSQNQKNRVLDLRAGKIADRMSGSIEKARVEAGWLLNDLAAAAGITPVAVGALAAGTASVAVLSAAINALKLEFRGIGAGNALTQQLADCCAHNSITVAQITAATGLPSTKISACLRGTGATRDLFLVLAYIAPKAGCRRSKADWQGSAKAGRSSDCRFTPPSFLNSVRLVFGRISIDPCANDRSYVVADRYIMKSEGGDGLREDWSGQLAFVNPPFSNQLKWLCRAHDQCKEGKVKTAVCLVPTKTCNLFFPTLFKSASIYALQGRLTFTKPDGKTEQTKFSLMVVMFGATGRQKARFAELEPGVWLNADIATKLWSFIFRTRTAFRRIAAKAKARLMRASSWFPVGVDRVIVLVE